MKAKFWRDAFMFLAVLLAVQPCFGQCPGGACPGTKRPAPILGILGRGGGVWRLPPGQPEAPVVPDWPDVPPPLPPDSPVAGSVRESVPKVDGGSGVLVWKDTKAGYVLTAAHVVHGEKEPIPVVFPSGERYGAYVMKDRAGRSAVDSVWDIALVRIPVPKAKPCEVALDWPKRGEAVKIAGHVSGRFYREILGRVQNYVNTEGGDRTSMLETTGEAQPGQSGGPILNSRGQVCGIVSGSSWDGDGNYTVGASLPRITALFDRVAELLPWRAKIRDEVAVLQENLDALGQEVAGKANRSELPAPPAEQKPYDDKPLTERLQALESWKAAVDKINVEQDDNLKQLNGVLDGLRKTAEEYAKSGDESKQALAAAVADVRANIELAGVAQKQVAEAVETVPEIAKATAEAAAKTAADEAVEAAKPGLLERLKERAADFLPSTIVDRLKVAEGLVDKVGEIGATVGMNRNMILLLFALVVGGGGVIFWKLKTGRELLIEKVLERLGHMAAKTATPVDDRIVEALTKLERRLSEPLRERAGGPPLPSEQRG